MLPNTETKNPSAIEIHVCKKIGEAKKDELDKDSQKLLLQLLWLKKDGKQLEIPQNEKPFLFQVIEKRVQACFDYKIKDHALILFLCSIAKNPAVAVMYLWYFQYWANKNGNRQEIDLNTLCMEIFPMGFPSDENMQLIWGGQKIERMEMPFDNLVDYASAGESLMFKK